MNHVISFQMAVARINSLRSSFLYGSPFSFAAIKCGPHSRISRLRASYEKPVSSRVDSAIGEVIGDSRKAFLSSFQLLWLWLA